MRRRPENRRHPRLVRSLPITYQRCQGSLAVEVPQTVLARDIGPGGVYLLCPSDRDQGLALHQELRLSIRILSRSPEGFGLPRLEERFCVNTLNRVGKVVRLEQLTEYPGVMGVAIKFWKPIKNRVWLREFISS